MVSTETLRRYLLDNYYYKDGFLYRSKRHKQWPKDHRVGTVSQKGYYTLYLFKKRWYLHQLIFLYHHGYIPEMIDHKDTNKTNNKISNLREIDQTGNSLNLSGAHSDNKLGVLGVHQRTDTKKYVAQFRGKKIGEYVTVTEAKEAYEKAKFGSNETSI